MGTDTLLHPSPSPLVILSDPILEFIRDGRTFGAVPALRTGPHPLSVHALWHREWSVDVLAYWYRSHLWCGEESCPCRIEVFHGEGLCVVAYADGLFGLYNLRHGYGRPPLDWDAITESSQRLSGTALADALSFDEDPEAVASRLGVTSDAVAGVRTAIETAQRRGFAILR